MKKGKKYTFFFTHMLCVQIVICYYNHSIRISSGLLPEVPILYQYVSTGCTLFYMYPVFKDTHFGCYHPVQWPLSLVIITIDITWLALQGFKPALCYICIIRRRL